MFRAAQVYFSTPGLHLKNTELVLTRLNYFELNRGSKKWFNDVYVVQLLKLNRFHEKYIYLSASRNYFLIRSERVRRKGTGKRRRMGFGL